MEFPVIKVMCGKCASWRLYHPTFGWSYCKKNGWPCDIANLCDDFRPSAGAIHVALSSWEEKYGEMSSSFLSAKQPEKGCEK